MQLKWRHNILHNDTLHDDTRDKHEVSLCRVNFFFMLNVVMLSVFKLNVIMLYVFMLNVLMLCVIMLNVVAPLRQTLLLMTFAQRCVFTKIKKTLFVK